MDGYCTETFVHYSIWIKHEFVWRTYMKLGDSNVFIHLENRNLQECADQHLQGTDFPDECPKRYENCRAREI